MTLLAEQSSDQVSRKPIVLNKDSPMIRHTRWAPLILVLALALTACGRTGSGPADPASKDQSSLAPISAGTQEQILGDDRSTPVVTYTLPWDMKPLQIDPAQRFTGTFASQAAYLTSDHANAVAAGLFSPDTKSVFSAAAALNFDSHKNFALIVDPLVAGTLGGGSMVAMACQDLNGDPGRQRLIVFSTTAGLAWIMVATRAVNSAELRELLTSITVLHPGPATGWFKAAPSTDSSTNLNFPSCETNPVKATVGAAQKK